MRESIKVESASLAVLILDVEKEWFTGEERLAEIIKSRSKQLLLDKNIACKDINIIVCNEKKKVSFISLDKKVKGSVLFPERYHGKDYDKYKLFMEDLILAQVA